MTAHVASPTQGFLHGRSTLFHYVALRCQEPPLSFWAGGHASATGSSRIARSNLLLVLVVRQALVPEKDTDFGTSAAHRDNRRRLVVHGRLCKVLAFVQDGVS